MSPVTDKTTRHSANFCIAIVSAVVSAETFETFNTMSTSFDRLFGKAATITGIPPSVSNNAAFRSFGKGTSTSAPAIGQRRVALSKSTSQIDSQLRRTNKPLPASTMTRRANASKRDVTHGLVVGQGGAHPTYSVEIRNRGPLDSRDVRPKVSRRIPGPTPTQYTDYLPPQRQHNMNPQHNNNNNRSRSRSSHNNNGSRGGSGGGGNGGTSVQGGVHTDRISFSKTFSVPQSDGPASRRDVRNGSWRPPTMTVSINNNHHHQQHQHQQ